MSDKHGKLLRLGFCEAVKILQLICCIVLSDYAWQMGGRSGVICGIVMIILLIFDVMFLLMDIIGFWMGRIKFEELAVVQGSEGMINKTMETMEELGKESMKEKMEKEKMKNENV